MFESNKFVNISNPKPAEALEVIKKAFSERRTLIVVGRCRVEYDGRAKSRLEIGERIVIIKEDGSLLVHRPTGYEPVNWQPPGSIFQVQIRDSILELHSVRQKPREKVKVTFDKLLLVSAIHLRDSGEFLLHASEEDMQKAILLKPSLLEEGFKPVDFEKKVEPGFVDIYGVDTEGRLVVVELKRKTAGKDAALQLTKYLKAIRERSNREIRGILVAPSFAKNMQRLLETLGLELKVLDPRKCAGVLKKPQNKKLEEFFNEKN
ncbi:endonuclease NucS [Candidatus Bathyarchaeota archaeon]|nr:endonuclease NucS [Candidatus Bathyarchaeota archaeon]